MNVNIVNLKTYAPEDRMNQIVGARILEVGDKMLEAICGCIIYVLFIVFILIMIADAFKKYNKKDDEKLDKEIDFAIRQMEAKNRE